MKFVLHSLVLAMTALSGAAYCAVSADEAAQLGKTLTPLGAERAGNADGSIPAWTGGLPTKHGMDADGFVENPYAGEKPLFVIDAKNASQYQTRLSPGQLALLKRYPNSYKIPIYPTHRSAALPDSIYQAAAYNAVHSKLEDGDNQLVDFKVAFPFPIPHSGKEAMWNHLARYRGSSLELTSIQVAPNENGGFIPVTFHREFAYRDQVSALQTPDTENVFFFYKSLVTEPARLAGGVLLVHETLNQVKNPRLAWVYAAGQRRVRRAPQVAYDGPYPASEGQRVADNFDMYNGAMDRYDWKLVGKRELYIPYNANALDSPKLKYTDVVKPGHLNPELTRYELHRVWEVQATLKPGERHIYAKRTYFLDEDSWQIVLADHYDSRGTLWRVAEGHQIQLDDMHIPWLAIETLYDVINGRYIASGLRNEEKHTLKFGQKIAGSEFTASALRSTGVR